MGGREQTLHKFSLSYAWKGYYNECYRIRVMTIMYFNIVCCYHGIDIIFFDGPVCVCMGVA